MPLQHVVLPLLLDLTDPWLDVPQSRMHLQSSQCKSEIIETSERVIRKGSTVCCRASGPADLEHQFLGILQVGSPSLHSKLLLKRDIWRSLCNSSLGVIMAVTKLFWLTDWLRLHIYSLLCTVQVQLIGYQNEVGFGYLLQSNWIQTLSIHHWSSWCYAL